MFNLYQSEACEFISLGLTVRNLRRFSMFALDSPAISDGLDAWKAWRISLSTMPPRDQRDGMVVAEKARAERIIHLLENHPQGLSVNSPEFRAALKTIRTA
jgi:hypothetical protein